jgi:copper homeostasis protein
LTNAADGIAFGVLTPERAIDVVRCRQLVEQIGAAKCVFHRAFDFTSDPVAALEILIDLGVRRVMTSGQQRTAGDGATLVAELIRRGVGRIKVLPAGGIRPWNVGELIDRTGCDQVHASLRERKDDEGQSPSGLSLSDAPVSQSVTSKKLVQEMVLLLGKRDPR